MANLIDQYNSKYGGGGTVPFGSRSTPPTQMNRGGSAPKIPAQMNLTGPGTSLTRQSNNPAAPSNVGRTPVSYSQTHAAPLSGGGGGGGGPAPAFNPDTDYLQEAGYLANISALDEALRAFNSQDTTERGRYDLDYDKGLRDLGYRDTTADITTDNLEEAQMGNRAWDWNDLLTASGRGYQTNTNDFASRGMLQSQGYLDSLKMLERSLEDQRGAMGTGRVNFQNERNAAKTNYANQDVAARQTAKVNAIDRLANSLGLM